MGLLVRILVAVIAVLLVVPGWSGGERLALYAPHPRIAAAPVALDPTDPARRRVGTLTYLGGVALTSSDPAFGSFSAISVEGDLFTLVSDGGNIARFRLGADWQLRDQHFGALPAGPGAGWEKSDRDSESMAIDGRSVWIGFERANAIWKYDSRFGRLEGRIAPRAMADWWGGAGAETMVRRADGSFLVLSEDPPPGFGRARQGLVFAGDPTRVRAPAWTFRFVPPRGFDPSDAAALPDGRLLVLVRGFTLPYRFANKLLVVERGAIRPGTSVAGREIATLAAPLIHDNFEGVAVSREGVATIVWLVSDDNQSMLQRSLLLKFRLDK